jgi:hypothetical protein
MSFHCVNYAEVFHSIKSHTTSVYFRVSFSTEFGVVIAYNQGLSGMSLVREPGYNPSQDSQSANFPEKRSTTKGEISDPGKERNMNQS